MNFVPFCQITWKLLVRDEDRRVAEFPCGIGKSKVIAQVVADRITQHVIDEPQTGTRSGGFAHHSGKSKKRRTSGQRAAMVWLAVVISTQRRLISSRR